MSNKVTIKVEDADSVNVGDAVCGHPVARVFRSGWRVTSVHTQNEEWMIPYVILQALCASGHVTREVDAGDVLEWTQSGLPSTARFDDKIVGVVVAPHPHCDSYFKVYDPRFTAAIKAKFIEIMGGNE